MYSRTYDAQRYSPLKQITRANVGQLRMAWTRGLGPGTTETIPIVHNGVMYVVVPGAIVQALDASNGDLLWEYKRKTAHPGDGQFGAERKRSQSTRTSFSTRPRMAMLSASMRARANSAGRSPTGEGANISGTLVVEGKVISGRGCGKTRDTCFIVAHDALTGKELWKFYNVPAPGEPGSESWGTPFLDTNLASTWGLPGTYDPVRKQLYWGIANAMPNTRLQRHNGNPDGTSRKSPADLYSNSTISLNPETGKLNWYYQHLPGDDWDQDYTHERTLVRTPYNPDPKYVKWFNPGFEARRNA